MTEITVALIGAAGLVLVALIEHRGKKTEQATARDDRKLADEVIATQREEIRSLRSLLSSCMSSLSAAVATRSIEHRGERE